MKKKLDLQLFAQEEPLQQEPVQGETAQVPTGTPQEQPQELLHQRFQSHMEQLQRQARELQAVFPGLDLRRELRDPLFSRLTSPGVGLSVEDAYYTVHRKELQSAAVQTAARQVSNAIASGARRPTESGLSGQAPAVSSFDYRSASPEQRAALKKQIRLAAAEGRKIYPGRG